MIKPTSSLFAKILSWFFLNLILVVAALAVFFAFQPQVNLYAIFGQEGSNRLQTAAMLIAHDLNQTSRTTWSEVPRQTRCDPPGGFRTCAWGRIALLFKRYGFT